MKYQQLTEGQRYQIALLHGEHSSCREIGLRVGVSKSTVSRELKRNSTPEGMPLIMLSACVSSAVLARQSVQ
jgi:IS30 family transposase